MTHLQPPADGTGPAKSAPTRSPEGHVLFDEAHNNFHTAAGRYKPFVDLMTSDGYRIVRNSVPFTAESLKGATILVIANALGAESLGSREAANAAFTPGECDAVRDWVKEGGSLLLITDHYPTGLAVKSFAERFAVRMSGGMTEEYDFTPESGLNGDHPICRGRSQEESVKRVRTFTGQSLEGPPGSTAILTLPEGAREMTPDPEDAHGKKPLEGKAVYPSQAVAFVFGKGRVVVTGEAAMLTAQLSRGERFGMNQPDIDNKQFALNTMHWLSGLLP